MDPGNHVLDGSPNTATGRAILRGKGAPVVKYRDTLRSSVQKRLKQSRCRLGCGLGWAQGIVCETGSRGAEGCCHDNHFLAFDVL